MNTGTANLRVSYLGGGYDFPAFFEYKKVVILSEALPISVACEIDDDRFAWRLPENLGSGLGSSGARHLSFIRARFPDAPWHEQIDAAIRLDGLQAGGWQDAIASAYQGLIKIVLEKERWSVYPLGNMGSDFLMYRRLYEIPVQAYKSRILTAMRCRESSQSAMADLVSKGEIALCDGDYPSFGSFVTEGWNIKKHWAPEITNQHIFNMEDAARATGAWGWKVCGAGGQGYFLVIGNDACHQAFQEKYKEFPL